ncbi:DsbA family protein [Candidatus Saccharibacteria bacterium]|nr:DsbA family protein [Candidatus Saccharibacteria bacterium]
MNKFTVAIIILILGAFGALVAFSIIHPNQEPETDYSSINTGKIIEAREENGYIADHVRGNANSSVVVVEYADYQCPGCASMAPHIDSIYNKYKDEVAFVFRNFPISGHANARAASAAAEAAGKQGYYWEMYEILYSNQSSWKEKTGEARTNTLAELFAGVAKDGDVNQFRTDLSNEDILKKIDFDYALGKDYDNVTATPSVHVNGEWVDITDIKTFDEVEDAICDKIDIALGKKSASTAETKTSSASAEE